MMQKESNREMWLAKVQEQSASGLSIRAWCAREGLTESTFQYWRKRLASQSRGATTLIALPPIGRPTEPALELQTPNGYLIRIASGEQLGWLKGLLEVLR